jgi:hypothetical protein
MTLSFGKTGYNVSIKAQNLSSGVPMENAGNCKLCGQWESDLTKEGYCRDEECKRGRELLKVAAGQAVYADERGVWALVEGVVKRVK